MAKNAAGADSSTKPLSHPLAHLLAHQRICYRTCQTSSKRQQREFVTKKAPQVKDSISLIHCSSLIHCISLASCTNVQIFMRESQIYLFRSNPGHQRGGQAPSGPPQMSHRAAVRTSISLVFSLDIKTHCSWTGVMTFTGSTGKDSDFFLIKAYCIVLKTAVKLNNSHVLVDMTTAPQARLKNGKNVDLVFIPTSEMDPAGSNYPSTRFLGSDDIVKCFNTASGFRDSGYLQYWLNTGTGL